tara:strand:- start:4055 stop:4435 length:381 start_codon:yes stop_codon:yes gene_type:complete
MQIIILPFNGSINTSLQVGDSIYYDSVGTVPNSGFSTSGSHVIFLGTVTAIDYDNFTVMAVFDETKFSPNTIIQLPNGSSFIMFGKNKSVNSSSLTGYYADVKFVNHRTDEVELFSVGSEISESSK